jgi:hypothetical protein
MSIGEYIALGVFGVSLLGVVWRLSHIVNKKVSYDSLDRCKKDVTENFVSKDIFTLTINTFKEDMVEMKKDVKELLKKANGKA